MMCLDRHRFEGHEIPNRSDGFSFLAILMFVVFPELIKFETNAKYVEIAGKIVLSLLIFSDFSIWEAAILVSLTGGYIR